MLFFELSFCLVAVLRPSFFYHLFIYSMPCCILIPKFAKFLCFTTSAECDINIHGFHDNSSTDISSTTLRLQTFRLLLYTSVQDSYTSNFCFKKSLFS